MIRRTEVTLATALLSVFGCGGSSQGTEPHDMTAEQHETSAGQEEQAAQQHAEQFDPAAETKQEHCTSKRPCWTSVSNSTEEHQEQAQEHRELAEKHRGAAQALRGAEAKDCSGLEAEDRDMSPFAHREDIAAVRKAERTETHGKHQQQVLAGGTAVFRAVPGMTAEWMQRLVSCHVARAAAAGHEMPEMNYCPLMVKGASAKVSSDPGGFAVEVTSEDKAAAEEIWRRMQALSAPEQ